MKTMHGEVINKQNYGKLQNRLLTHFCKTVSGSRNTLAR